MEIFERILAVRKYEKLSQESFGERLGMSRSMVVNLEMGKLKNEDQVKRYCRMISTIFNVNETWLLDGTGDMHDPPSDEQEIANVVSTLHINSEPIKAGLIKGIAKMNEESLSDILSILMRELNKNGVNLKFDEE